MMTLKRYSSDVHSLLSEDHCYGPHQEVILMSQVNERMLDKAVEGQLGSVAKYGEHQDAAVLFCELQKSYFPV